MRIESISKFNYTRKNYAENKQNKKVATSTNSIQKLNGMTPAYYGINFGSTYGAKGKKAFQEATENFTLDAQKVWEEISYIGEKSHTQEITQNHVFLGALLVLNKYIDDLNSGAKKYGLETQYDTPLYLEESVGCRLFSDEETRSKTQPVIKRYIKEIAQEIKNTDAKKRLIGSVAISDDTINAINTAHNLSTKITGEETFYDSDFIMSLVYSSDKNVCQKMADLRHDLQKACMIDDNPEKQKNHLSFYDNKADQLWKNLDHGNDVYVTYEGTNKASAEHLISSFTNLINKPGQKYKNLTPENTKITIFNSNAIFEVIANAAKEARKDPEHTHIFIADFSDVLVANTQALKREDTYIDDNEYRVLLNEKIKNLPSNVRLVLMSNKDTYYLNMQTSERMKKCFERYNMISIPLINNSDTKDMLKSEAGGKYIESKIQKRFTPDAIERIVDITNGKDGYYPEKALNYMQKVSLMFGDKDEINLEDVAEYEKQTMDIKNTEESQGDFKIIFDTSKKLDDIVGNSMTKAEAQSVVKQILSGKKGLTKGYRIYLDEGGAYGGGRRHTAEAIAGEAQIPMLVINAKDFALKDIDALSQNSNLSEIKIKKLINTAIAQAEANKNKTAMIYIENFDNFGSNPLYGISSVYEQKAFSQLLSEMEDVRKNKDVNLVVMGSINHPEYIDENIMKPYQFLDSIPVYQPQSHEERIGLLNYYIDKKGLELNAKTPEEQQKIIKNVAETTEGFSVVDLMYLLEKAQDVSEARGKDKIDESDFTEAYLQRLYGRISSRTKNEIDNEITTKHECGHGITLQVMYNIAKKHQKPWHMPDKLNFITLDSRGSFGGMMQQKKSPSGNWSFEHMFSDLVCDFGGHSCEKKFYGIDGSWGITQDMQLATKYAELMVTRMGMGARTGKISMGKDDFEMLNTSQYIKSRIDKDMETILKNAELVSNKIVDKYSGFIDLFAQKYANRTGTQSNIISSEEFNNLLDEWRGTLSKEQLSELDNLEKEILEIIEKTKKGEIAKQN